MKNAVGDAGTLGLLQMVNHSCNPNCRLRPVDTYSGLVLFTLEALRDIPEGEEITIDYDARAAQSSKLLGLSFWQWNPPTSPGAAAGLRRIECGCAGEGLPCPNRLWRDEPSVTDRHTSPGSERVGVTKPRPFPGGQNPQPKVMPKPYAQTLSTEQRTTGRRGPDVATGASITDRSHPKLKQQKLHFSAAPAKTVGLAAPGRTPPVPLGALSRRTAGRESLLIPPSAVGQMGRLPEGSEPHRQPSVEIHNAQQLLDRLAAQDQDLAKELRGMKRARTGVHGYATSNELLAATPPPVEVLLDRLLELDSEEKRLEAARQVLTTAIADINSATSGPGGALMAESETSLGLAATEPPAGSIEPALRPPVEEMSGVYILPHSVPPAVQRSLLLFLTQAANHVSCEIQTAGRSRIAVVRDHGRTEIDLGFLRGLRRADRRLRTRGQHPLLDKYAAEAALALNSIDSLHQQFRAALIHIGVRNPEEWSYYAYALITPPGSPPQEDHQDRGTLPSRKYFTCLLPLSEGAELTQFVSENGYRSFPGPVMFDGRVWHRAPKVGGSRRLVLALVACAGADVNHSHSKPFRDRTADWDPHSVEHSGKLGNLLGRSNADNGGLNVSSNAGGRDARAGQAATSAAGLGQAATAAARAASLASGLG